METRNTDSSVKHFPWKTKSDFYFFEGTPIVIDAAPDAVWEYVKNIGFYSDYSNGAITASFPQGELEIGNTIKLELFKNELFGKVIGPSYEKISAVDNEKHVLGWERTLPLKKVTERYQVLEPMDNGTKTKSYIGLAVPSGAIGFFTSHLLRKRIERAFTQLNEGIQEAAEAKGMGL